jgi:hypothetical protein
MCREQAKVGDASSAQPDALRLVAALLAIHDELERLRRIEAAAIEFCRRCERGEVRSRQSYDLFVAALRDGQDRRAAHEDAAMRTSSSHSTPAAAATASPR